MSQHGYIALPPDGAGKKLHTIEQVCPGHEGSVHNQIFSLGDPLNPTQHQYIDNEGQAFVRFAEGAPLFDAFGKTKVSNETHLNNFIAIYNNIRQKGHVVESGGAVTHSNFTSRYTFSTDAVQGSKAQWTSHKRMVYTNGVGMYYLCTMSFGDQGKAGVVRRFGMMDDEDGVFFAVTESGINVGIRTNTSGTPVDTLIPQENFNRDKLDGTGLSGHNIDLTKVNIFWFDFQWLGAGRVRFGVIGENGARVTAHVVENANNNNTVWMSNPCVNMRVEQENIGTPISSSEMFLQNFSLIQEGEFTLPHNRIYSANLQEEVTATKDTTNLCGCRPMWSMRLKQEVLGRKNYGFILPHFFDGFSKDQTILFQLRMNGTLTGATWDFELDPNSIAEGDATATSINGGRIVFSKVVTPGEAVHVDLSDYFGYIVSHNYMKINAAGVADILTCTARRVDGLEDPFTCFPLMTWREVLI